MINCMGSWKDKLSIVLVEPVESGNVGATTRAMKNMGFTKLELVNAPKMKDEDIWLAHNSREILKSAIRHDTIDEAFADKSLIIGVTRRTGKDRGQWLTMEEAAILAKEMSANNNVALVFGREARGLYNEEALKCHYMITIPTEPEQPSLNLSHAVAVVAYEFHKTTMELDAHDDKPRLAAFRETDKLYDRMLGILVELGYTNWGDREMGRNIVLAIKSFLDRAELKERDVRILNGICGRLEARLKSALPLKVEQDAETEDQR